MTTEYKPPAKLTPQRLTTLAAAHRMYKQHDKVLSSACVLEEISSLAIELKAAREELRRLHEEVVDAAEDRNFEDRG